MHQDSWQTHETNGRQRLWWPRNKGSSAARLPDAIPAGTTYDLQDFRAGIAKMVRVRGSKKKTVEATTTTKGTQKGIASGSLNVMTGMKCGSQAAKTPLLQMGKLPRRAGFGKGCRSAVSIALVDELQPLTSRTLYLSSPLEIPS